MSNYDHLFDSEVVDVGTRGIDRGEDDYVPTDEYTPGVDDDEVNPFLVREDTTPDEEDDPNAPRYATDCEELQEAMDGADDAEEWESEVVYLRLALDIALTRWPELLPPQ